MDDNGSIDITGLGADFLSSSDNNNSNSNSANNNITDADKIAAQKAIDDKAAADKLAADKAAKDAADKAAADLALKNQNNNNNQNNAPQAVEIDGVQYKLDDKGNALNDKGEVFKSKAELDQLELDNLPPLAVEIAQKLGYTPLDEKGNPKVYQDTIEDTVEAVKDIATEMNKKFREEFLNSDPEFKEFVEYKARGGKLEDFVQKKTSSWKSVRLDESNEAQLESVVIADLVASGMSDEQAKETASLYKDTKKLKEFGKAAYQRLVTFEDNVEKQEKLEFETRQKQQQEDNVKFWTSVKTVIDKGVINGIIIPESDKESFNNYLSKAVDNKGNSQRNLDRMKLPLEQSLQLDYLLFKGFNLDTLVKSRANTQIVNRLRDRINKNNQSGLVGGEGANKNAGKPNELKVTVDDLMP